MFEILQEADMVLNACGRPDPPPGYKFVDLPRVIPFFLNFTNAQLGTPPTQGRIANTADTVFICRGVGVPANEGPPFRIRWPDGRFLSQFPGVPGNVYPLGVGSNLLALNQERQIRPGERISIEVSAFPPPPPPPLFGQEIEIPAPFVGTGFAAGLAMDGGFLVVGYPAGDAAGLGDTGAVLVYQLLNGVWTFFQLLEPPGSPTTDSNFGSSVAINAGTIVVGNPSIDVGASALSGQVTVWVFNGTQFVLQQTIPSPSAAVDDAFGASVAVNGNFFFASGNGGATGGVYIFQRTGTVWAQTQLVQTGAVFGTHFSTSPRQNFLSMTATVAVLGNPAATTNQGEIFIYTLSGSTWSLEQTITDPGATNGDKFGVGNAISGNTIVVGAPGAGLVYVYNLIAGVWTLVQTLRGSDTLTADAFGFMLSLDASSGVLMIGAPDKNADQGVTYYFQFQNGLFVQRQELAPIDGEPGDSFGGAVAVQGFQAAIGGPNKPFVSPGVGALYVFGSSAAQSIVAVSFWGVLRYMLKDTGEAGAAACLVGYPTAAKAGLAVAAANVKYMRDPEARYAEMPRLACGPNNNLLAPEFLLGNQCCEETPAGYEDESFTFFSGPITVPAGGTSYGNVVIVPGSDDVVIKSMTPFVTYTGGLLATTPTFALRLPNGYSYTGGDQVPWNLLPNGAPTFPTLRIGAGGRIIIDAADINAFPAQTGASVTVIQFDGVKRRKKAAA